MKNNTRLRKIRVIVKSNSMTDVYGVVLPPSIISNWLNVYVKVIESGNVIILESGALPTPLSKIQLKIHSKKIDEVYI